MSAAQISEPDPIVIDLETEADADAVAVLVDTAFGPGRWVKTAERSPVVYIQHGHDNNAWANPNFRRLLLNAIKWTVVERMVWAWILTIPVRGLLAGGIYEVLHLFIK